MKTNTFCSKWIAISIIGICLMKYANGFAQASPTIVRTIYISSSSGNDANDGSINKPKKTINGLSSANRHQSRILLKRNDIFYEGVGSFSSCIISSYGEGALPVLCGFRKLNDNKAWKNESGNIWRLDMGDNKKFSGYNTPPLPYDNEYKKTFNNIGFIYDETRNVLHGHMVSSKKELKKNWDIFTSSDYSHNSEFRYVYIYHEGSLKNEGVLCFAVYKNGFIDSDNCELSNIEFRGFGQQGINEVKNCTIKSCIVDKIGGSIQLGYAVWTRYGNGIQCWIGDNNNNLIENCWVSRTYDCGSTIQGTAAKMNAVNIVFRNNVFYHCRQAFENFLRGSDNLQYVNCEFSGNLCFDTGTNEFDSPENRDANILANDTVLHSQKIKMSNNLFVGGNHLFANPPYLGIDMKNNSIYIYKGQYLNDSYNHVAKPIYANSTNDVDQYNRRVLSNDNLYIIDKVNSQNKIKNYVDQLYNYFLMHGEIPASSISSFRNYFSE